MTKRNYYILALFAVMGAWHITWQTTLSKLEIALQQNINQVKVNEGDINTSYELVPFGYPFKVGFNIENILVDVRNSNGNARLEFTGENKVFVNLKDIPQALINNSIVYHTEISNFKGIVTAEADGKKASVALNVVRSIGEGVFDKVMEYKGIASDIDFYVTSEEVENQRLLTINNLSVAVNKDTESDLLNVKKDIEITGATFFDLKGENSLAVDRLNLAFSLENLPASQDFVAAFKGLSQQGDVDGDVDLIPFKEALKTQIKEMSQHKSRLNIESYDINIGEFSGHLSGHVFVDEAFKPQGKFNVSVENIDKILSEILGTTLPYSVPFKTDGRKMEFFVESKNNMFSYNGIPLIFNIPSLLDVVDRMPNKTYQRPSVVEEGVTSDIEAGIQTQYIPVVVEVSQTAIDTVSEKSADITETTVDIPVTEVEAKDVSVTVVPETVSLTTN